MKNLLERAAWTFVQGALATGAYEAIAVGDPDALRAAYVGGAAALLSAVKTFATDRLKDLKEEPE